MRTTRASCASHGGHRLVRLEGLRLLHRGGCRLGGGGDHDPGRTARAVAHRAGQVGRERSSADVEPACRLLEVELARGGLRDPRQHGHRPFGGGAAGVDAAAFARTECDVEEHLPRGRRVGDHLRERRPDRGGRARPDPWRRREPADPRLQPLGGDDIHRSRRGDASCVIAVEAEDQRFSDAAEAVHLLARERRATACDRVLDTGGVRRDDVEVALDDDRGVLASDRGAGEVEPKIADDLWYAAESGLFRYFGFASPSARPPKPSTSPRSSRIGKHEAVPEPVAGLSALLGMREPRLDQFVDGRAALAGEVPRQRVLAGATAGREADAECARERLVDPALMRSARPGSPAGRRPEHMLVVRLRLCR